MTIAALVKVPLAACVCMAAASAQTYEVLAHFSGAWLRDPFVQGVDGQLYSSATGSNEKRPAIFKISTAGKLTTVTTLVGYPEDGLAPASGGDFYGAISPFGGPGGDVFRLSRAGKLTAMYTFCSQPGCADGIAPAGPPIDARDGNLYGITVGGAVAGPGCPSVPGQCGTFFKLTPAGALTTLYHFCTQTACADGASPSGQLVQASDGNFYGATLQGGSAQYGTVFRITPAGVLTTLHSFCTRKHCPDGANPRSGLIQAADGALYGTTSLYDTIFRITLDGKFETLHTSCSEPSCADGYGPNALIQATDGNFYGTTAGGGAHSNGAIFQMTPAGVVTTLYNFCSMANCADGGEPLAGLFQATGGSFYGTTFEIGDRSHPGVVFRLSTGLTAFVIPLPAEGNVGRKVTILGTGLAGTVAVSFNGTPAASFLVNSTGSAIAVTVPDGATTGSLQVTLADGSTLTSNVPFRVR